MSLKDDINQLAANLDPLYAGQAKLTKENKNQQDAIDDIETQIGSVDVVGLDETVARHESEINELQARPSGGGADGSTFSILSSSFAALNFVSNPSSIATLLTGSYQQVFNATTAPLTITAIPSGTVSTDFDFASDRNKELTAKLTVSTGATVLYTLEKDIPAGASSIVLSGMFAQKSFVSGGTLTFKLELKSPHAQTITVYPATEGSDRNLHVHTPVSIDTITPQLLNKEPKTKVIRLTKNGNNTFAGGFTTLQNAVDYFIASGESKGVIEENEGSSYTENCNLSGAVNLHIEGVGSADRDQTCFSGIITYGTSHRITLKNIIIGNASPSPRLIGMVGGTITENGVAGVGRGKHILDSVSFSMASGVSPFDTLTQNNFLTFEKINFGGATLNIGATPAMVFTSASSTGAGEVTFGFSPQANAPFNVGGLIVVSGASPAAYNGVFVVKQSNTNNVKVYSSATGTATAFGVGMALQYNYFTDCSNGTINLGNGAQAFLFDCVALKQGTMGAGAGFYPNAQLSVFALGLPYTKNQNVVVHNAKMYLCINNVAAAVLAPDVDTTNWQQIGGGTIANNSITNAMLAQMPANSFMGNNTGSASNAKYLTANETRLVLGIDRGMLVENALAFFDNQETATTWSLPKGFHKSTVVMTGNTPTTAPLIDDSAVFISLTADAATAISGTKSVKLVVQNGNPAGCGMITDVFNVSSYEKNLVRTLKLGFSQTSNQGFVFYLWDVLNSKWIYATGNPNSGEIEGLAGEFVSTFQLTDSTQYRLACYTKAAATSDKTLITDNYYLGREAVSVGKYFQDWTAITIPSIKSLPTDPSGVGYDTSSRAYIKKDGLETLIYTSIKNLTAFSPGVGDYFIDLSSMASDLDVSKYPDNGGVQEHMCIGDFRVDRTSDSVQAVSGTVWLSKGTKRAYFKVKGTNQWTTASFGNSDDWSQTSFSIPFSIPLAGGNGINVYFFLRLFTTRQSNVVMSSNTAIGAVRAVGTPNSGQSFAPNTQPMPINFSNLTGGMQQTTTGVVRVPISGTYDLTGSISVSGSYTNVQAYVNGARYGNEASYAGVLAASNTASAIGGTYELKAGDTFELRSDNGGTLYSRGQVSLTLAPTSQTIAVEPNISAQYVSDNSPVVASSVLAFNKLSQDIGDAAGMYNPSTGLITLPTNGDYEVGSSYLLYNTTSIYPNIGAPGSMWAGREIQHEIIKNGVVLGDAKSKIFSRSPLPLDTPNTGMIGCSFITPTIKGKVGDRVQILSSFLLININITPSGVGVGSVSAAPAIQDPYGTYTTGVANLHTYNASQFDYYYNVLGLTPGANYAFKYWILLGTSSNLNVALNNGSAWNTMTAYDKAWTAANSGINTSTWVELTQSFVAPASGVVNMHWGAGQETSGVIPANPQVAGTVYFANIRLFGSGILQPSGNFIKIRRIG
jgi:hypothetical protein